MPFDRISSVPSVVVEVDVLASKFFGGLVALQANLPAVVVEAELGADVALLRWHRTSVSRDVAGGLCDAGSRASLALRRSAR